MFSSFSVSTEDTKKIILLLFNLKNSFIEQIPYDVLKELSKLIYAMIYGCDMKPVGKEMWITTKRLLQKSFNSIRNTAPVFWWTGYSFFYNGGLVEIVKASEFVEIDISGLEVIMNYIDGGLYRVCTNVECNAFKEELLIGER